MKLQSTDERISIVIKVHYLHFQLAENCGARLKYLFEKVAEDKEDQVSIYNQITN